MVREVRTFTVMGRSDSSERFPTAFHMGNGQK